MKVLVSSFRYYHKMRWQAFVSYVNVDVYSDQERLVVVLKDPGEEGSGISVTNGFEEFATHLVPKLGGPENIPNITWVEYYPHGEHEGHGKTHFTDQTWDLVTLLWNGQQFTNVEWRHLTKAQFETLLA